MTAYEYIKQYQQEFENSGVNFVIYDIKTNKQIKATEILKRTEVIRAEWVNWSRYRTPNTRRLFCKII